MNFGPQIKLLGKTGNRIKAFLFDLDGTLVDSANQIFEAVELTRSELRFDAAPAKFIHSKIGLPAKDLFQDLNLQESELSKAVELFRSHLSKIRLSESDLYVGVPQILRFLHEKGFKLGVATNKPTVLAVQSLLDTGIHDFFDFIVGAENHPPKPDPTIILKCLEFLLIEPHQATMVGDRVEDILAAKAAKVIAIGIAQGTHDEEDFLTKGADSTFMNMSMFYQMLIEGEVIENI
jgi:phosphoglycolate phosphatase